MTRPRHTAPARGVPVLVTDELAARRLRQREHALDAIARAEARRAPAAATCTAEALPDRLRLSLVLASGPTCPMCGTGWLEHTTDLGAHLDAVLGEDNSNPGAA